jgi:hypothetical protein
VTRHDATRMPTAEPAAGARASPSRICMHQPQVALCRPPGRPPAEPATAAVRSAAGRLDRPATQSEPVQQWDGVSHSCAQSPRHRTCRCARVVVSACVVPKTLPAAAARGPGTGLPSQFKGDPADMSLPHALGTEQFGAAAKTDRPRERQPQYPPSPCRGSNTSPSESSCGRSSIDRCAALPQDLTRVTVTCASSDGHIP